MELQQFLSTIQIGSPSPQKLRRLAQLLDKDIAEKTESTHSIEYFTQIIFTKLPSAAFEDYFSEIFLKQLPEIGSNYLLQCALNFGVQELAARSRVSPKSEQFFQVGCFHPTDYIAAILNGMSHTRSYFCSVPFQKIEMDELQQNLDRLEQNSVANFKLIKQHFMTYLPKQIDTSIGFLALLNLKSIDNYKTILSNLSRVLTWQGTCLIVDRESVIQEVSTIAESLSLNREISFTQESLVGLKGEKTSWLLLNAHKNSNPIQDKFKI